MNFFDVVQWQLTCLGVAGFVVITMHHILILCWNKLPRSGVWLSTFCSIEFSSGLKSTTQPVRSPTHTGVLIVPCSCSLSYHVSKCMHTVSPCVSTRQIINNNNNWTGSRCEHWLCRRDNADLASLLSSKSGGQNQGCVRSLAGRFLSRIGYHCKHESGLFDNFDFGWISISASISIRQKHKNWQPPSADTRFMQRMPTCCFQSQLSSHCFHPWQRADSKLTGLDNNYVGQDRSTYRFSVHHGMTVYMTDNPRPTVRVPGACEYFKLMVSTLLPKNLYV